MTRDRSAKKRTGTGYLLLGPGMLWLAALLRRPVLLAGRDQPVRPERLGLPRLRRWSYQWSNYWRRPPGLLAAARALAGRTAPSRPSICLVLGYVLAYAIAFKAGRWKNLMLVLVIAPFFTSFLVRTLSWKLILSDDGVVVNTLQFLHILGADGRLLATPFAVIAGLIYNFLPFMVLPLFASIDKIDHRLIEAVQRPLRQPGHRLLQGDLAALAARRRLRHPAHLHPGGRRLHQRPAARQPPRPG